MLIHSIVSENDIFCINDICMPVYENINGGFLEIENKNGTRGIKRLYSTDPYMYLDKRYMPCNKL